MHARSNLGFTPVGNGRRWFSNGVRGATLLAALASGAGALAACGDDDGGDAPPPPADMGTGTVTCPMTAPPPANQMGPCCARASNAGRLDAVELRLAGIRLRAPSGTLTSGALRTLLNQSFDAESFNWLIQTVGAPTSGSGPATIRTGYGKRAADGTFSFAMGEAPAAGGDPARWDPLEVMGAFDGETFSAPPLSGVLIVPVFNDMTGELIVELPLYNLAITSATLSEQRTCIGRRMTANYDTSAGNIEAYIRVADARARQVVYGTTLNASLCAIIAGSLTEPTYCDDRPQAMWGAKPDSLCSDGGACRTNAMGMTDVCDPDVAGEGGCNAWRLVGEIAAQGVEITP
jgi:hypothetical protein